MAELLQDIDALIEVARTFPEPARSWARAQVAVWAPERFVGFPTADGRWEVVVAAGPPGLDDALLEALAEGPPTPGVAQAVASLPVWGRHPDDPAALRAACEAALEPGHPSAPWLALFLARTGPLPAAALRAAAACPDGPGLTAALTIHAATAAGQGQAVAAQVVPRLSEGDLSLALAVLGLHEVALSAADDPALAARIGMDAAATVPPVRGSRRSRMRAVIDWALGDLDTPYAHALRAAADHPVRPPGYLAAEAAWLARRKPADDVVDDIARHFAETEPERLRAARRALGPEHREVVWEGLVDGGFLGAAMLAVQLDAEAAAPELFDAFLDAQSFSMLTLMQVCTPYLAEDIPDLVRRQRDLGVVMAQLCPTLEVLDALLATQVPAAEEPRADWALALATTGDAVAAEHVRALAAADPDHPADLSPALALVEAFGH